MILGIVVGRPCEVVPVGLAVGDENENVVASMTMVVGSQLSVLGKVAVGRMLVTPTSVVVDELVSEDMGMTTGLDVIVGSTVAVEFPFGTEPVGKVVLIAGG
jgi:hypothetical protein